MLVITRGYQQKLWTSSNGRDSNAGWEMPSSLCTSHFIGSSQAASIRKVMKVIERPQTISQQNQQAIAAFATLDTLRNFVDESGQIIIIDKLETRNYWNTPPTNLRFWWPSYTSNLWGQSITHRWAFMETKLCSTYSTILACLKMEHAKNPMVYHHFPFGNCHLMGIPVFGHSYAQLCYVMLE